MSQASPTCFKSKTFLANSNLAWTFLFAFLKFHNMPNLGSRVISSLRKTLKHLLHHRKLHSCLSLPKKQVERMPLKWHFLAILGQSGTDWRPVDVILVHQQTIPQRASVLMNMNERPIMWPLLQQTTHNLIVPSFLNTAVNFINLCLCCSCQNLSAPVQFMKSC